MEARESSARTLSEGLICLSEGEGLWRATIKGALQAFIVLPSHLKARLPPSCLYSFRQHSWKFLHAKPVIFTCGVRQAVISRFIFRLFT
jgi:hypothetical protein